MEHVGIEANNENIGGMTEASFGPSDLLDVFNANWLDEAMCRFWVLFRLHHHGVACPACRHPLSASQQQSFFEMRRIKCAGCGKFFNALSGTFLSGTRLDFRQLVLLNVLLGLEFSDQRIAEFLQVDRSTVWSYRQRIQGTVNE